MFTTNGSVLIQTRTNARTVHFNVIVTTQEEWSKINYFMKTWVNENNVLTYYIIYLFINSLTTISKIIYVYSSNVVTKRVVGN